MAYYGAMFTQAVRIAERIATALERIAAALEKMAAAPVEQEGNDGR